VSEDRIRKFRQAAFVYLHVGILYLAAVWAMGGAGLIPGERGPLGLWMVLGALILAVVFWGLWSWRNPWFARIVWAVHALRLPALIQGAFFGPAARAAEEANGPGAGIPSAFYLTALFVVLVNLWMLARAGWDL
jgi:hypothetical protein